MQILSRRTEWRHFKFPWSNLATAGVALLGLALGPLVTDAQAQSRDSFSAKARENSPPILTEPGSLEGRIAEEINLPYDRPFNRISSFPVFLNTDVDDETVAEIVTAAYGGNLLVYTDSQTENIGFVDITDPENPLADGIVGLAGEPTSVAVKGHYALAAVNTSTDFINTSGLLQVIHIPSRNIVRSIELGGQPDSIAVSPNGRYAAIAIENERDELLCIGGDRDGEVIIEDEDDPEDPGTVTEDECEDEGGVVGGLPQDPPGFVVIVDLRGSVNSWSIRIVDLVGVPDLFPDDPEPEYVDINQRNEAVVTLQENNHIVIIKLTSGRIVADFPAGTVDLEEIDIEENDLIEQAGMLTDVPREPDGVTWLSGFGFSTADEGDLFGGSRGITNFWRNGGTAFEAGNSLETRVTRMGHYPEARSENKGNEPEGVEFGSYWRAPGYDSLVGASQDLRMGPRRDEFLFAGSERSSVIFVYRLVPLPFAREMFPQLVQVLPAGVGPEGLVAIPERDLFVVASEDDARGDGIRSVISIYKRSDGPPIYPTVRSADRSNGLPIPWGALSALVVDPSDDETLYTVHDSFYQQSRIFAMDISGFPAVINDEIVLMDTNDELLDALTDLGATLPGSATGDYDPTDVVNDDGTVNLDLEGITIDSEGNFWIASEGSGNLDAGVSDAEDRPFESPNLIAKVAPDGTILEVVLLPTDLTLNQLRFGFEGIAPYPGMAKRAAVAGVPIEGDRVCVAFQRAWRDAGDPSESDGDPQDLVRIGCYDTEMEAWGFAYYPLDTPTSPNGGWVGLSELTHVEGDTFTVIERDNQAGRDATIKRIYSFSLAGIEFMDNSATPGFDIVSKTLVRDILVEGDFDPTGGLVLEKLEGLAVLSDGTTWVVNDNDGVDDSNGETQLIDLGDLFD